METNLFFTYGTLLKNHDNEYARYLIKNSKFLKNGKLTGKLYDLGNYPGAVYEPDSLCMISGNIFLLRNPEEVFNVLDEYEGYGAHFPVPNEFIRKIVPVACSSGTVLCWTYLYNLPVDHLSHIQSGDYASYLNALK